MFTDLFEAEMMVQERMKEFQSNAEQARMSQGLKKKRKKWQMQWGKVALVLTSLLTKTKLN
jgi:hypothetical protein